VATPEIIFFRPIKDAQSARYIFDFPAFFIEKFARPSNSDESRLLLSLAFSILVEWPGDQSQI
jgi:hypothetical protein